ncbi:MAG: ATP-dependent 6-phosphofructokinase, partial [Silvanigrellaceae bacterium]|nr:ATP-dependent 6-phosphofructokinase [Silvanigrellaceae bacterium]
MLLPQLNFELLQIDSLTEKFGRAVFASPLKDVFRAEHFVEDGTQRILVDISLNGILQGNRPAEGKIVFEPSSFELAGPRKDIFWNPTSTKVAIVTCGGLAPGLNNVIQSIVTFLFDRYKVENIYGIPYGYNGFKHDEQSKRFQYGWRRLDRLSVQNIDFEGGSVLGTGRGFSSAKHIVDALLLRDINILFTIGGDGTLAASNAVYSEIKSRNIPISLIGIPKTIDNDVLWVSRTFGFDSAVGKAVEALRCAQTEARSAYHGIGLVKLMGRNCGALAATAVSAINDIDFILVPEIPLKLYGELGFLSPLAKKVVEKGYATIAVAEGAGQDLFPTVEQTRDLSGNIKLKDIGRFLQEKIIEEFKVRQIETTLKYIDPSYMLRAQTTSADDSVFCA